MPEVKDLGIFVQNTEQRVVVSSRDVARVFEKEHKHVMEAIRNLEFSEKFAGSNFRLGSYKDSQNQERPEYIMSRDGFTILAMGFTGPKAMEFKEAYIRAFNAMEKALWENEVLSAGDEKPVIPVAALDFKTARFALDGVTAFRDVMPIAMKKRIMRRYYELIGVSSEAEEDTDLEAEFFGIDGLVDRFVDERCMSVPGARLDRGDFYLCFSEWCAVHGWDVPSRVAAIRSMNRLGRFRSGRSGYSRYWEGIRCA